MKHKKLIFGLGVPLALILVVFLSVFLPLPIIIPHHKITLRLPFESGYDITMSLIPMGETIYHPDAPGGHPGLDFGAASSFPIIAAMDGTVTQVLASSKNANESKYDVRIQNSRYFTRYFELDTVGPNISKGAKIHQGDVVGTPHLSVTKPGDPPHVSMHWEFGSTTQFIDRLCPVNYFDTISQRRVAMIWGNVQSTDFQNMKQHFPDICSGAFHNKVEPSWMTR